MLAPLFIRNGLLIPEKNNMRQVSATVCNIPNCYWEKLQWGRSWGGMVIFGGKMYYYVSSESTPLIVCSENIEFKIILLYVQAGTERDKEAGRS